MKRKIPPELRDKLIKASDLPPLEPAEERCLCNDCAETLYPQREFKWISAGEVLEPCEVCQHRTFPKQFQKRTSPLKYIGE